MTTISSFIIGAGGRDGNAVSRLARLLFMWMVGVSACIATAVPQGSTFFRFGPHADFVVLGIRIDTGGRYAALALYCFVNSMLRTVHHNVVSTWIINNVQDEARDKSQLRHAIVYEIVAASTMYAWWDWVVYIFILLSQIDMVLIEVVAELSMAFITTLAFLQTPRLPVSCDVTRQRERLLV
jgi:amino acid permease